MKIEVTQEDIDNGMERRCWCCPIALAVQRVLGHSGAYATRDSVHVFGVEYALPVPAKVFILNFDNGLAVQPFTFELPI